METQVRDKGEELIQNLKQISLLNATWKPDSNKKGRTQMQHGGTNGNLIKNKL